MADPAAAPALRPLIASELEDPSFGQNCIGCSPRNPKGLHLHFEPHGHEVRAEVVLDASYESYPGMIHGGIIALLLDEVTGRAALWQARCFVVTLSMRIRYGAIMRPGVRYVVRAEVEVPAGGKAPGGGPGGEQLKVTGVIEDEAGTLVATATSTFAMLRGDRIQDAATDLPEATRALAHELSALGHSTH